MYAKLKLTIEPVELNTELLRELKEKFDNNMKTQEAPAFDISQTQSQQSEVDKNENDIIFSFQDLKPFSEKVKLENDDNFIKGKMDKDKRKEIQAAASQGFEMFRSLESLSFDIFEELLQQIKDSLSSGSLLGYPVINAKVKIEDGRWSNIRSKNPIAFKTLASQLMEEVKKQSETHPPSSLS